MKLPPHFIIIIVGILAASLGHAEDKNLPSYGTTEQIKSMTPCAATLARRLSEYSGSFTTADGKTFVVGDERGEQSVWHFVAALKVGKNYKLPDSFLSYLAAPSYPKERDIVAMAQRTGTLVSRSPCSALFVTAGTKWFSIGDPGSEHQVTHFLWTLKDGQDCKFPDAFLGYLAAPRYVTAREITAMTPCTARLATVFNEFCYFTTADGKGFIVGNSDKDNEADVRHFLGTLEEGKTYKLPAAFLDPVKRKQ